jgi:hypothetical protein
MLGDKYVDTKDALYMFTECTKMNVQNVRGEHKRYKHHVGKDPAF